MSKLTNYLKNKHSEYGDLKFNMISTVVGYTQARNTVFTISTNSLPNYCYLLNSYLSSGLSLEHHTTCTLVFFFWLFGIDLLICLTKPAPSSPIK